MYQHMSHREKMNLLTPYIATDYQIFKLRCQRRSIIRERETLLCIVIHIFPQKSVILGWESISRWIECITKWFYIPSISHLLIFLEFINSCSTRNNITQTFSISPSFVCVLLCIGAQGKALPSKWTCASVSNSSVQVTSLHQQITSWMMNHPHYVWNLNYLVMVF